MVCAKTSQLGHKDLKSLLKWWQSLQGYHLDAPAVLRMSPPLSLVILKWSCEGATIIIEELLSVSFFWEFGNQETEKLRGLPRVSKLVRDSTDSDHVAHTPSPHNGTWQVSSLLWASAGVMGQPLGSSPIPMSRFTLWSGFPQMSGDGAQIWCGAWTVRKPGSVKENVPCHLHWVYYNANKTFALVQ